MLLSTPTLPMLIRYSLLCFCPLTNDCSECLFQSSVKLVTRDVQERKITLAHALETACDYSHTVCVAFNTHPWTGAILVALCFDLKGHPKELLIEKTVDVKRHLSWTISFPHIQLEKHQSTKNTVRQWPCNCPCDLGSRRPTLFSKIIGSFPTLIGSKRPLAWIKTTFSLDQNDL